MEEATLIRRVVILKQTRLVAARGCAPSRIQVGKGSEGRSLGPCMKMRFAFFIAEGGDLSALLCELSDLCELPNTH